MSSSSPASIRALLSRTGGGGADCQQSPRSLLSRILLRGGDHNGGNGGGGTFGCRVRLPRRYSSNSSTSSVGGARKDDGAASEQSADDVGSSARIKVVQRAPDLPVDTPRSSLGRKKPEEELVSMNLGLGASLVLLLSKSALELNKMVEVRSQMEALVSEIRQEATLKEKQGASAPAPASSQESNGSTTTVISDPIARAGAAEDALSDNNCSGARTADRRAVIAMDQNQMEAELQIELSRLQTQQKRAAQPMHGLELPPLQVKTKSHVRESPSRSCVDDGDGGVVLEGNAEDEEEEEEEEGYDEEYDDEDDDRTEGHGVVVDCNNSPPHGGVSARALERRLHELLQRRQQDRIVQLEAALDGAQRRLQEREREVVWWRDAAKLVSHRRDESRRLRCTAAS
ncbi:unnamed protein product [Alopecurus aequalis]